MQKGVITVNGVPTYAATWGGWIEDDLKSCKDIVLCISGNPGVTGYYYDFLETIHSDLGIPVWILSHAGHEVPHNQIIPSLDKHPELYDLHGQIEHKIAFIKKYIPRHVNIYFIGHSIGCKMILDILKDSSINSQVRKSYFLFPTVERMAESPNGKFLTGVIKPIVPVIVFLSWIFTLFPKKVKRVLLYSYFTLRRTKCDMVDATLKLINATSLQNVFFLAMEEMEKVKELDHDAVNTFGPKLMFYYGLKDNWTPLKYYEDLKKCHPEIEAVTCTQNFSHAFVLNSSKEVGYLVSRWIKSIK